MKVKIGEQEYVISWRFENPTLNRILENNGITAKRAAEIMDEKIPDPKRPGSVRRMGIEGLAAMLGMKKIPIPSTTTCIIKAVGDSENEYTATVRRFPGSIQRGGGVVKGDVFDKDKARKYSLYKVLKQTFPEKDDRKAFWDAYLTRNVKVNVRKEASV
jgi:hypothetical protein